METILNGKDLKELQPQQQMDTQLKAVVQAYLVKIAHPHCSDKWKINTYLLIKGIQTHVCKLWLGLSKFPLRHFKMCEYRGKQN